MKNSVKRKVIVTDERRRALDAVMSFHPAPTPAELAAVIEKHPVHANRIREVARDMLELMVMTGARRGDPIEVPTEEELQREVRLALGRTGAGSRSRSERDRTR